MDMKKSGKFLYVGLLVVPFLGGCAPVDWVKDKLGFGAKPMPPAGEMQPEEIMLPGEEVQELDLQEGEKGGEVIVSMNSKPIVTVESLKNDFKQLLEDNPQLKSVLPLMPDAEYNFCMGMVSQAVVDHYVAQKKMDKQKEYQAELARMSKSVRRMLNTKYFAAEYPVMISEADVKKFYDENKETMPDLLVSQGGIKASGVSFEKEADAKEFMVKVKGKDFAKTAKESKLNVSDFKLVNKTSLGMDSAVREKVTVMTKFPAVEMVKGEDKKFWVVSATGSEASKYRDFKQVEANLRQYMEKDERMKVLEKEINKLKQEYNVVVDEQYFKAKKEQQAQAFAQQQRAAAPKFAENKTDDKSSKAKTPVTQKVA